MKKEKCDSTVSWVNIHKSMTEEGIRTSFLAKVEYELGKDKFSATKNDYYIALANAIRDRLIERWINTQQRYHRENVKRVYYLSMEFLIGRLLIDNILNLGILDKVKGAMEDVKIDLADLQECEADAGLGNGGLGRLAACFLDSMATLGIPSHGYGICYDYGIFEQKIINGYQIELPDDWLREGNPWQFQRLENTVRIKFHGHTNMFYDNKGELFVEWVDTEDIIAMPYDIPVIGYESDTANTLRLWAAKSSKEFDLRYFNEGDYERAVYDKVLSENISKVLYPSDNLSQGKELRLKQEYFFTAASIHDIIRRFKEDNEDIKNLPEKAAIQLNDTHPSIGIVELMRKLIDEEKIDWDTAWSITVRTFAYTNHTVMSEALECWPVSLFEDILPRHLQIIYEINRRFLDSVAGKHPGDNDRQRRMSIIQEGAVKKIRMAFLAIIGSHSINGVSQLHTNILKTSVFKDFYDIFPERFNNKTNGITQRRWLYKSNSGLSDLITKTIGNKWVTNLFELEKLMPFIKNSAFCSKWQDVKRNNKKELADYIYKTEGIKLNLDSIFDVQVKRIHEYKRQLLFVLYIISQYLKLKDNPKKMQASRTFIFGGKAAPGYFMAKLIIKLINNVADIIDTDCAIKDNMKVVFLENYRVSLAERIFPASDLSEQISTAGTEASGTGCMKFMMNGALTLGTYDGANIEIAKSVGDENIFSFGLKTEEIARLRENGYNPQDYIYRSEMLSRIIKLIKNNFFSRNEEGIFKPITDSLLGADNYFICADFEDYCGTQDRAGNLFLDKKEWTKKSIINVAKSGRFSSDRTITEYAKDIWDVPVK